MGIDSAVQLSSRSRSLKDDTPIASSSKVLRNVLQLIIVIRRSIGSIFAHQSGGVTNIGPAGDIGIHHLA